MGRDALACSVGMGALLLLATGSAFAAEPVASSGVSRTAADWYRMGGVAMHGLALCSIVSLGLVAERLWALRAAATLPKALDREIAAVIEGREPVELKRRLEARPGSSLAEIARRVLHPEATHEAVEACGVAEVHRLQRNLPLLASVGNLATMIGLFGTVLGMIEAFDMIAISGTGDARVVAGGIFRALVTTAAGLGIGISALGAHALLARSADERSARLEERAAELYDAIHGAVGETVVDLQDVRSQRGARS